MCYRLRTSAETSLCDLARHGCPVQAIVAAFGFDERTVAAWWAFWSTGAGVREYLVNTCDLGQVQADDPRQEAGWHRVDGTGHDGQDALVAGGEVSAQRDMPLIRRLSERVRRCAARRPLLICTDGLVSYIRAMRETFRDSVHTGMGGRPRLQRWRHVLIAQVVKRYERRRVVETERRIVDGTPARGRATCVGRKGTA